MFHMAATKITEKLSFVGVGDLLNRFKFNQQAILDQYIGCIIAEYGAIDIVHL